MNIDLERYFGRFSEQLVGWAAAALPNLIAALLILIVGLSLAFWAGRTTRRVVERSPRIDTTFASSLGSIVTYGLVVVVAIATLGQLGFQTTSLLAALGAAGLAIGLALQGTLSNIAAGVMILWLGPFRVGEYIQAGDAAGTVKDVGLFATELHSYDNVFQFVPNSQLWNERIVNYSRLDRRLVDLTFGVDYGDDTREARRLLLGLAGKDERIFDDPEPYAFVHELADSAVVLGVRVWCRTSDYWDVRRYLLDEGKTALEAGGVTIPFPQLTVHAAGANGSGAMGPPRSRIGQDEAQPLSRD